MKRFSFVLSIFGLCCQVYGTNKYTDYTFLKINPYNSEQVQALNALVDDSEDIDIFKRSHGPNDTADMLVSPNLRGGVLALAKLKGMQVQHKSHYGRLVPFFSKIQLDDGINEELRELLKYIRAFDIESRMIKRNDSQYTIFGYNSYDDIQKRIKTIAKKARGLVRIETLGHSYEGRVMKLIKISSNHKARYPIIFIEAGVHAREWAAPAFAMYIVERLTQLASAELGRVDWYILPLVNPDGYEYTRADPSNRMWRKTRSKTWKKNCFGVDLNRNFGYKWGYDGASFDPCEFQTYAGRKAFSEREARMVRKIMLRYTRRIKLYLSLHTYGPYMIYPWAYTGEVKPPGWKKIHSLAETFSNAVVKAGEKPFELMSAGEWYPTGGASLDFAFAVAKIPYSYVLEITEGHEFVFPANLLHGIFPKYYQGLIAMAKEIKKEFQTNEKLRRIKHS